MARVSADPDRVAPTEFARFQKVLGTTGEMRLGDQFAVRMPGPWDGPVRVVDLTPTSFRLATLEGHLEAGQVEFRASAHDGELLLTIESWAASGDRFSWLLYERLRMAKEVQLHMWTSFLERAARLSGGRLSGGIVIETRRLERGEGAGRALREPAARRVLDQLHGAPMNFDPEERAQFTSENGWLVDEYRQALPAEAPGPPLERGSWQVARRLIRDYEFADPRIVRAIYYPDRPLEGRDMLLEVRFYGLRFRLGVRVGAVRDETAEVRGHPVRIWGWNYRTLQGHLEMGQMDFEVWKWLQGGGVEFRTRRFSRHARVGNPIVSLGVRLFGRRQQVKFARRACERMAELTAAELAGGDPGSLIRRAADQVSVRPGTMDTAKGGTGSKPA